MISATASAETAFQSWHFLFLSFFTILYCFLLSFFFFFVCMWCLWSTKLNGKVMPVSLFPLRTRDLVYVLPSPCPESWMFCNGQQKCVLNRHCPAPRTNQGSKISQTSQLWLGLRMELEIPAVASAWKLDACGSTWTDFSLSTAGCPSRG